MGQGINTKLIQVMSYIPRLYVIAHMGASRWDRELIPKQNTCTNSEQPREPQKTYTIESVCNKILMASIDFKDPSLPPVSTPSLVIWKLECLFLRIDDIRSLRFMIIRLLIHKSFTSCTYLSGHNMGLLNDPTRRVYGIRFPYTVRKMKCLPR